jgi:leucyl aminopeptidase
MPLVENMPSGTAARQDDIVTCMNGMTVEIISTDAEGRLILADALCYTEKFHKPDIMFDLATLTTACLHALGHYYSGMMTHDTQLAEQLYALGQLSGDRIWRLPLDNDYRNAYKSSVADVRNCTTGVYLGGSIAAGSFLSNFVQKSRWVHIDIAGTAHDVPDINYISKGSAGAGVRLLAEYLLTFVNK